MCDIMVPWKYLRGSYQRTEQCKKGVERKRRRFAVEEEKAVTLRAFSAYGRPLELLNSPLAGSDPEFGKGEVGVEKDDENS